MVRAPPSVVEGEARVREGAGRLRFGSGGEELVKCFVLARLLLSEGEALSEGEEETEMETHEAIPPWAINNVAKSFWVKTWVLGYILLKSRRWYGFAAMSLAFEEGTENFSGREAGWGYRWTLTMGAPVLCSLR